MKASFLIDKKYQILYQYLELEFHLQLMLLLLIKIFFFADILFYFFIIYEWKKALSSDRRNITTKVIQYFHNKYPISIYDAPGFANGSINEINIVINEIKKFK